MMLDIIQHIIETMCLNHAPVDFYVLSVVFPNTVYFLCTPNCLELIPFLHYIYIRGGEQYVVLPDLYPIP